MENKKETSLKEELEKEGVSIDWLVGLTLISSLFGDWGSKSKFEELEKRIAKLETKNELMEKLVLLQVQNGKRD